MKTTNSGPITKFKEFLTALQYSSDVDRRSLSKRNKINPSTATYPNLGIPDVLTIEVVLDKIILAGILTPPNVFYSYEIIGKLHNYQNVDSFQY